MSLSPPKPHAFVTVTLQASALPVGGFLGPKSPKDLRNFDYPMSRDLPPKHADFPVKPVDIEAKPSDIEAKPSDIEAKPSDIEVKPSDISSKEVIENSLGKHNEYLSNTNKDLCEKYRAHQKESLNDIEKIKSRYSNLFKSSLSEEKREFIKHKYYFAKSSLQIKLDIFSEIFSSFKGIIFNSKDYLFLMLRRFFNSWSFEHLFVLDNLFGLSLAASFVIRIIRNKPLLHKTDLLKFTGFMFYLTPILVFTPWQIYYWFVWFMFIVANYLYYNYHTQMSDYIEQTCGDQIRAFVNNNFYKTINPISKLSSFPPLYKFKFQLICLKENIMSKIVIALNKIPSASDLIDKLESELIFYITQRQLFVDIIWRVRNGRENFYPDESVILFKQYIEVIDHLVEEMQGRVAELRSNLRGENARGGLKEDKRIQDNWEDDGTDY